MAKTYSNLYSVGPGAIGPGTYVVKSLFNPQKSRGVITRMHQDSGGISTSALSSLSSLSELYFPGTTIPLNYTNVRQLSNTLAMVVSSYGNSNGANGFKRVMSRSPTGSRRLRYFPTTDGSEVATGTSLSGQVEETARPVPRYRTVPLMVIRWSNLVYGDARPADNFNLVGKYNTNNYYIDGYSHEPFSLRFEGTSVIHEKWGGIDRWILMHAATYDKYLWVDGVVKKDGDGKWILTEKEKPYADSALRASFPNLP